MNIREATSALRETRMRVWKEAENFLNDAHHRHPGKPFNAEERAQWDRYMEELDDLDSQVRSIVDMDQRERESAVATEAVERQFGRAGVQMHEEREADELRAFLRGERGRTLEVDVRGAVREREMIRQGATAEEVRSLLWDTGSSGSLVPTLMARSLYQYAEASMAIWRMPTNKIITDNGDPMTFPKVAAHGIGTQVIAQGTAIGGTDPTFNKMTLDAYKYGQLVQLSSEVVQDSAVAVVDFVMGNMGRAVGRVVGTDLVLGTGTGEPHGIMVALAQAGAGSVTTGGSLINPTYETLVDAVYNVNDEYRARPSAAWLMKDSTAAVIRKLRDGAGGTLGAPLWQPSLTNGIQNGEPDRLLGFPVYTDTNVAALASNSRSIAFGDWNAYFTRAVGNIVLERSDDFAFSTDLVTLRAKWRVDADLIDLDAIKTVVRNV